MAQHAANPSTAISPTASADPKRLFFLSSLYLFIFGFIIFNFFAALRHSIPDRWTVAIVSVSHTNLLLFCYCTLVLLRTPAGEVRRRERLAVAIWLLALILITMAFHRMAKILTLAVAVVVWAFSAFVIIGIFFAKFLCREDSGKEVMAAGKDADACDKC